MNTYDVGIVGAGIHGVSTAYHLASRGVTVGVFDKGAPASGPTGRSSAVCRAYYRNPFLASVAHESLGMLQHFGELTGGRDAGFQQCGALFLHPLADVGDLEDSVERLNALGVKTEILTTDDVADRFPRFELDGVGVAAWESDAGFADPAGTTLGLFERAVELGAEPHTHRAVREIQPRASAGATLVCDDGLEVSCGRTLIAAGPWTKPLAAQLGVDLPLTVQRHIVAVFGWGSVDPIPFVFADLVGGYYAKPEGEELLALGSLDAAPEVDPDDFPEEITEEESAVLAESAVARIPALGDSVARGGWASLYDMSPDWQPVIGEIAPGVFVDAGTSGHGFKLALALGRHVADLVSGEDVDNGLEQFHPRRFNDGGRLSAGYGGVKILG